MDWQPKTQPCDLDLWTNLISSSLESQWTFGLNVKKCPTGKLTLGLVWTQQHRIYGQVIENEGASASWVISTWRQLWRSSRWIGRQERNMFLLIPQFVRSLYPGDGSLESFQFESTFIYTPHSSRFPQRRWGFTRCKQKRRRCTWD